jgi:hypothetical protein
MSYKPTVQVGRGYAAQDVGGVKRKVFGKKDFTFKERTPRARELL